MSTSVEAIKELRNLTSASFADCKKALHETNNDVPKAVDFLRKRGLEVAAKKGDRAAKEGRVEAYIHHGSKIGVLLEVDCETDFVAKNPEFMQFTKDLAMQIAAFNPAYIKREDVPESALATVEDKEVFYKEQCLLEQVCVKDSSLLVKDYLGGLITKMNEKIVVRRFVRYQIGG